MDCKRCRTEIEEAGGGARLGARAAAHAASCRECGASAAERERLRLLVAGLGRVEAPADFEFRLRARLNSGEGARVGRWGWRGMVPSGAWVVVAGCLVLAAALFAQLRTRVPAGAGSGATGVAAVKMSATADGAGQETTNPPDGAAKSEPGGAGVGQATGGKATVGELISSSVEPQRARVRVRLTPPRRVSPISTGETVEGAAREVSPRLESSEFSVRGEPVLVSSPVPVPVVPATGPMEVTFRDGSGASRVITVPSVIFGGRGLPAARPKVVNASVKDQGVW